MFGFSVWHVTMIAVVALVFIGPKEIPKVMRVLGRAFGQIRRLSAEFQAQFNELLREAELAEERTEIQTGGGTQQAQASGDSSASVTLDLQSQQPGRDS